MDYEIIMLNSRDVARILRCSVSTARRTMLLRDFPLQRIGRSMLVEKSSLYLWLQKRHAA